MDHGKYFNDLFEAISSYRTIVLIMFLIKNDENILEGNGFLKNDIIHLCIIF